MDEELRAFIETGMSRFGRAQITVARFGKHLQEMLSGILRSRAAEEWAPFVPSLPAKIRSTTYGQEYPLRNARMEGSIDGKPARVTIAVNWFQSETDYPFYATDVTVQDSPAEGLVSFAWREPIKSGPDGPILTPSADDFDLDRDFSILLDELVRFMRERFG